MLEISCLGSYGDLTFTAQLKTNFDFQELCKVFFHFQVNLDLLTLKTVSVGLVYFMFFTDKFLSRMKEELIKKDQKIYTCDLITMIELAETQEQIDLTVKLVYR